MQKSETTQRKRQQSQLAEGFASSEALAQWLVAQANEIAPSAGWRLLAHCENGVVWGKVETGHLCTAHKVYKDFGQVELKITTLQRCRLFCQSAELMLWRNENEWHQRSYRDDADGGEAVEYFDEAQILWGTQIEAPSDDGFTLVSDGIQGLLHAPPLVLSAADFDVKSAAQKQRPLRLLVRHYLTQDEDGIYRVAGSRLVELTIQREPSLSEGSK